MLQRQNSQSRPAMLRSASNPYGACIASPTLSPDHAPAMRTRSATTGHRVTSSRPLWSLPLAWRRSSQDPDMPSPETELAPRMQKQKSVPSENLEGWGRTRASVAKAAVNVLGLTGDVVHEVLIVSVDMLEFAPCPGLRVAAHTLLGIWDALQDVDINRRACLGLTERCASILLSVRQEAAEAGDTVEEELCSPIAHLVESFTQVQHFLLKQNHRSFLSRYLKREELHRNVQSCNNSLNDALGMFSLSMQIRIMKQIMHAEEQRQVDTAALVERLLHVNASSTEDAAPSLEAATPPPYVAVEETLALRRPPTADIPVCPTQPKLSSSKPCVSVIPDVSVDPVFVPSTSRKVSPKSPLRHTVMYYRSDGASCAVAVGA